MEENKSAKNNILYFILAYICLGIAYVGIIYALNCVIVLLMQVSQILCLVFNLIVFAALCVVLYKVRNKMDNYFSKIRFVNYGRWISVVVIVFLLLIVFMY